MPPIRSVPIRAGSAREFVGAPPRLRARENRYFPADSSMAIVSSHILDSVSGKSAVGIACQLFVLGDAAERRLLFDVTADNEGRIAESLALDASLCGCEFELVFHGAEYFTAQSLTVDSMVKTVVIRFVMDDDQKRYHLPLMLSPHSYSTWWSG